MCSYKELYIFIMILKKNIDKEIHRLIGRCKHVID